MTACTRQILKDILSHSALACWMGFEESEHPSLKRICAESISASGSQVIGHGGNTAADILHGSQQTCQRLVTAPEMFHERVKVAQMVSHSGSLAFSYPSRSVQSSIVRFNFQHELNGGWNGTFEPAGTTRVSGIVGVSNAAKVVIEGEGLQKKIGDGDAIVTGACQH